MERRQGYKGFVIEARPYQLRDMPGWTAEFYIEDHHASGVTVTQFFFEKPQVFESEELAIRAAITAGQRKIDAGFTPTPEQTPSS